MSRPTSSRARHFARTGAIWFLVSTALLVAPLFFVLGNRIEPRIFGLPFSLVYVLGVVLLDFAVLAALYVTRAVDGGDEDDG